MPLQSTNESEYGRFGQAFINYGSYHYDTTNKIIHIICIPLIAATFIFLLSYIPFNLPITFPMVGIVNLGVSELSCIVLVGYYVYLNVMFGVISGLVIYLMGLGWKKQFDGYTAQELFYVILFIQIFAWVMQFVGHGVFEKRKPALMDNISQILNAPMFVMIELCELGGLRTKQIDSWKVQIKKNVMQYRNKCKNS